MDLEEATQQADDLIRGAVTTLSKPLGPIPTYSSVDTVRADETLNRAEETSGEVSRVYKESTEKAGTATEAEKKAIGEEGKVKAELLFATAQRQKLEAQQYQFYQRLFGLDASPDSEIANAAARMRQIRDEAGPKLDRIQKLGRVSVIDDPIQYIMNQLDLPAAISDYNADVAKVHNLQGAIDDGIQTARNAGDLANKGIPTITDAQAKANADIALAEAAKQKAQADLKLASTNVDFATKKLSMDLALANSTRENTQLEIRNEELKYTSMINAIRLVDTHAARQEAAGKLLLDLIDKKALDVLLKQYDATMGHPPGATNRFLFQRLPAIEKENIVGIAVGSAGVDPFTGYVNFSRARPGQQLSPETSRMYTEIQGQIEALRGSEVIRSLPKEEQAIKLGAMVKEKMIAVMNDAWKQGNLYHEMEPAKMIAANAVPAGTKLADVLAPLTNVAGPIPTNTVIEAIMKEWKNPAEAGAVGAEYYRLNMELRNKSLNGSLFGIYPPTSYIIPVKRWHGIGYAGRFDITTPDGMTKYILSQKVQDGLMHEYSRPVSAQ